MNSYLSPYETVTQNYELPFDLYPFQKEAVNELATYDKSGLWFEAGTGKTSTATVMALYKLLVGEAEQVIVIVPPMVINTWKRWLAQITDVSTLIYQGSPKDRKQMSLTADFIVVGLQIFKKDFDRFTAEVGHRKLVVLVDEAHGVKNVASENYKKVSAFATGQNLMLLTGTPVTSPLDCYAYAKLIVPTLYRSMGQFQNIFVEDRDFFGNVSKWRNLDLLSSNLMIQARRVLKEDVLTDLPPVTYTPVYYDLDPAHLKLYSTLAEQQILLLESGGKIDATSAPSLWAKLQQCVVNWDHFSGDETKVSNSLKIIEQVLDEIGGKKLIVFGQYRMTNRKLVQHCKPYGVVAAFGDQTVTQNMAAVDKFIADPSIRIFVAQPQSAGTGLDGLQHIASDVLYIESPVVPRDFHQSVARVHRQGQKQNVNVRIGIAEKTIQARLHRNLMDKDALVNNVIRGFQDLRDSIYGD